MNCDKGLNYVKFVVKVHFIYYHKSVYQRRLYQHICYIRVIILFKWIKFYYIVLQSTYIKIYPLLLLLLYAV